MGRQRKSKYPLTFRYRRKSVADAKRKAWQARDRTKYRSSENDNAYSHEEQNAVQQAILVASTAKEERLISERYVTRVKGSLRPQPSKLS